MKINRKTKISEILRFNTDAIEAIASVNPHFNKLRNPILRRVLAPRVNVEDASRIGKCKVDDIFDKLSPLGFEVADHLTDKQLLKNSPMEIEMAIKSGNVIKLDVRPILASGVDPFNEIIAALNQVPDGFALEVINSFEPVPLIKILGRKGYLTQVFAEGELFRTYFLKGKEITETVTDFLNKVKPDEFESLKAGFKGKVIELDVREMEMPMPMVTILNELQNMPDHFVLFVHHKKVPQYLIPEIENRRFKLDVCEIGEGNIKLLIHR